MKTTLLCNAGLALHHNGETLLIDLPNRAENVFYRLPDDFWTNICDCRSPYEKISGICFTHTHGDHFDKERLLDFTTRYPDVPCFVPKDLNDDGIFKMGIFTIEYHRFPHAPIDNAPPHVVFVISAGEKQIYIAADAALDCEIHRKIINGRYMDAAFWTPMYLSRQETRTLLKETASKNVIYHMPVKTEECGIWKKCENNFKRYPDQLDTVLVPDRYPTEIIL